MGTSCWGGSGEGSRMLRMRALSLRDWGEKARCWEGGGVGVGAPQGGGISVGGRALRRNGVFRDRVLGGRVRGGTCVGGCQTACWR